MSQLSAVMGRNWAPTRRELMIDLELEENLAKEQVRLGYKRQM